MNYEDFIASKLSRPIPTGLPYAPESHESLFPHQRILAAWALKRGRAAIFAATGLGKTRMQIQWARHIPGRVLILAPLAVAQQTSAEAASMDVEIVHAREQCDAPIVITNYERLHKFDASKFTGVVLDESSCIKHQSSKTFQQLTEAFAQTQFKLCATATPAPNDYTELGTHAEFLGVCTKQEMLAEFFCHDGGETSVWRLKGHARKEFWRWVATWGALVRKPSDIGFWDDGYNLPPLSVEMHTIAATQADAFATGRLFLEEAKSLSERRAARKGSTDARVAACVAKVNAEPDERWVVWCELNAEQDALAKAFGDECFSVYGSLDIDEKERRLNAFVAGERRILLGKPSIFGFGLNLQMAARMAFVGVSDSWESYFQAVRRCWRFGQTRPVNVHVFAHEAEGAVVANLLRKEADAENMADELSKETCEVVRAEVRGLTRQTNEYVAPRVIVPAWLTSEESAA